MEAWTCRRSRTIWRRLTEWAATTTLSGSTGVPDARELRLVEVMRSVATTNEIMPFRFAPTDDIPVPSVMILVSEDEFAALRRGALRLPESWGSDAMDRLQRLG